MQTLSFRFPSLWHVSFSSGQVFLASEDRLHHRPQCFPHISDHSYCDPLHLQVRSNTVTYNHLKELDSGFLIGNNRNSQFMQRKLHKNTVFTLESSSRNCIFFSVSAPTARQMYAFSKDFLRKRFFVSFSTSAPTAPQIHAFSKDFLRKCVFFLKNF